MKKVLLARIDNIGDFILTTPFISALCDSLSPLKIVFIASPYTYPLVKKMKIIDEVIVLDAKKETIINKLALINRIRKEKFDIAIFFHPSTLLAIIIGLSKAKIRIGYEFGWVRPFSSPFYWLLTHRILSTREAIEDHMVTHFLKPLKILGIPFPTSPKLTIPEDKTEEAKVEAFLLKEGFNLNNDKIIALQLCPKWIEDGWEEEDFLKLCKKLLNCNNKVKLLILYKKEYLNQLSRFLLEAQQLGITCFGGDLFKWIYLIKNSSLFIGYDSGGIHIAVAFGKPVIDIFIDPWCKSVWYPFGVPYVSLMGKHLTDQIINGANKLLLFPEFNSL